MKQGMYVWVGLGLLLVGSIGISLYVLAADEKEGQVAAESRDLRRAANPSTTGVRSTGRSAPTFDRSAPLEERVAALEHEVEQLHAELAAVRLRTRIERPAGIRFDDGDPDEVRAQVSELLDEERQQERDRRAVRIEERMQSRVEDSVRDLGESVKLSDSQRDAVANAWSAEAEQVAAMIAEARSEGSGFGEVREKVQELRAKTDEAMREELDADQMEAYREVRSEMGPGGGRGAPGRGQRG